MIWPPSTMGNNQHFVNSLWPGDMASPILVNIDQGDGFPPAQSQAITATNVDLEDKIQQFTCQEIHLKMSTETLPWRHNEPDGVSNHQPRHCLLNCLFRCRSNKTSKLRVTGLCAENSPGTGEFSAQKASNIENISIWWRHHRKKMLPSYSIMSRPQSVEATMGYSSSWHNLLCKKCTLKLNCLSFENTVHCNLLYHF